VEVTIAVSDGSLTDTQTFILTVNPVNDSPIQSQLFLDINVLEDNEDIIINLSEYFTDIDSNELLYSAIENLDFIDVNVATNILTIHFIENLNGSGNIEIITSDGQLSINSILNISVDAVNDIPIALSIDVITDEDTSIEINLEGEDVDGDALTYLLDQPSLDGSVSIVDNIATFTPNPNYNGNTSFAYIVNDGVLNSSAASVNILVNSINDAPISNDLTVVTDEDVDATIFLGGSDIDGDNLVYLLMEDSPDGFVDIQGSVATFTSEETFNGST
ncbi:uncharacterized protein METZ01_LOCUS415483, partial [marine metagenome]